LNIRIGINANQFYILKHGDRFWYENGQDKHTRFSVEQLNEIKKTKFARIYCDALGLEKIQRNPFNMMNNYTNPFVSCSSFYSIDLSLWKEKTPQREDFDDIEKEADKYGKDFNDRSNKYTIQDNDYLWILENDLWTRKTINRPY
jgi:hypothetical protein